MRYSIYPHNILLPGAEPGAYQAGQIIEAGLDLIYMHEITGLPILRMLKEAGSYPAYPEKILLVFDHYSPTPNVEAANMKKELKQLASEFGIKLIDNKPNGISHALLPELGLAGPGMIIAGADSHTTTLGALGCFAAGFGSSDIAKAVTEGKIWLKLPEILTVKLNGKMPGNVSAKDLSLSILRDIPPDELNYKCIFFTGDGLFNLSMEERFTLCNMMAESGAKNAIIAPDEITRDYLLNNGYRKDVEITAQNPDIQYDFEINLDELRPLLSLPAHPSNVTEVSSVEGIDLDVIFIGGCTNGRFSDIEIAAKILDGKQINEHVRLIVTPATSFARNKAAAKGYLDILSNAGAEIYPPGCGACFGGHGGVLGEGEKCLSTTNRNFPGRMGAHSAAIYLAGPQTAAVSAINGRITYPKENLS